MKHYIKLELKVPRTKHTDLILEFDTGKQATDFQTKVNAYTGIPFSCDYGNDRDGFKEYSCSQWSYECRIKVELK